VSLSGCATGEYMQAVKKGAPAWYIVKISALDSEIQTEPFNIYKLTRKASSPEGKREKLKADSHWGEGHGSILVKDHGEAMALTKISWDDSKPAECHYEINVIYVDKKEQFANQFTNEKDDACDKTSFETPYLSGRLETEDRKWMTLNFELQRSSAATSVGR
jgi:hypothetical protein